VFSTCSRVLAAVAVITSLAASFSFAVVPGAAYAQATAESPEGTTEPVHRDDEHAGGSRGGYAWGHEGDQGATASGPAAHHFSRIYVSLGAGFSTRIIQYLELGQERFAPAYLQLRGGYFFEGDGNFQHGLMLGLAPAIAPDGTVAFGHDAFGQWVLSPNYMARLWLDGDLGNWLQLTGRVGVPFALGEYFSWGVDVGLGAILEFLTGFGIYVEADFSMFFAADIHPLFSLEGGLVIEYEVLP
jgi:hypothetical protein